MSCNHDRVHWRCRKCDEPPAAECGSPTCGELATKYDLGACVEHDPNESLVLPEGPTDESDDPRCQHEWSCGCGAAFHRCLFCRAYTEKPDDLCPACRRTRGDELDQLRSEDDEEALRRAMADLPAEGRAFAEDLLRRLDEGRKARNRWKE
jgi:hypothetical protein